MTMTTRRLNSETGDIVTRGEQFTDDKAAIAQTISTRLRLFYGEYFRDITDGTQWFQLILGKGGNLLEKDTELKRRIIQTEGVIQLISFSTEYDIDARAYSVDAEILTSFGLATISISEVI